MKTWRHLRGWMLAADLLWSVAALALAVELREPGWYRVWAQAVIWWPVLVVILMCWALLFSALQLDGFGAGWRRSTIVSQCLIGVMCLMLVIFAGGYAGRLLRSRLALGYFALIFAAGVVMIRLWAARRVQRSHRAGRTARTLVLGDGPLAQETARRVRRHPELGWTTVGFMGLQQGSPQAVGQRDLHTLDVLDFVRREGIEQIVVAMDETLVPEIQKLLEQFRRLGLTIIQVPAQFELYSCRSRLLDLDGIPVICFEQTRPSLSGMAAKQALDYAGAALALLVTCPVWITVALAARMRMGRAFTPIARVGHQGHEFRMWRLNWGELEPDHPLRRFGVSELPQLWNVLRGEMSLIGPRPEAPEVAKHYSEWQRRRLDLRPGITGLAQVHGWREKQRERERYSFDLEYVMRWSLWLDVAILLQTASTLYRRHRRPPVGPAQAGLAPCPGPALPKDGTAC